MKLWKSKKNNNTNSNSTISCVPGKSSTLVKNNDAKTDVATTSSTNVSGKLMKIYRTTDGFVTVVLTNKSFKKKKKEIFSYEVWHSPENQKNVHMASQYRSLNVLISSSLNRLID